MTTQSTMHVTAPKVKMTDLERITLKKSKIEWRKNMRASDPNFNKRRGCIGCTTKDIRLLSQLLKAAEMVQIEKVSKTIDAL